MRIRQLNMAAISYIIIIAFSLFLIYEALHFPNIRGVIVGPEVWPIMVLTVIIISSAWLLFSSLREAPAHSGHRGQRGLIREHGIDIAIFISVLLYFILFRIFGFLISSIAFTLALFIVGRQRLITAVIVGITLPLALYLIFTQILEVPVP